MSNTIETIVDGLEALCDGRGFNANHAKAFALANAAPDMLNALENLLADKYLSDPINADRMREALAAINKAKSA